MMFVSTPQLEPSKGAQQLTGIRLICSKIIEGVFGLGEVVSCIERVYLLITVNSLESMIENYGK